MAFFADLFQDVAPAASSGPLPGYIGNPLAASSVPQEVMDFYQPGGFSSMFTPGLINMRTANNGGPTAFQGWTPLRNAGSGADGGVGPIEGWASSPYREEGMGYQFGDLADWYDPTGKTYQGSSKVKNPKSSLDTWGPLIVGAMAGLGGLMASGGASGGAAAGGAGSFSSAGGMANVGGSLFEPAISAGSGFGSFTTPAMNAAGIAPAAATYGGTALAPAAAAAATGGMANVGGSIFEPMVPAGSGFSGGGFNFATPAMDAAGIAPSYTFGGQPFAGGGLLFDAATGLEIPSGGGGGPGGGEAPGGGGVTPANPYHPGSYLSSTNLSNMLARATGIDGLFAAGGASSLGGGGLLSKALDVGPSVMQILGGMRAKKESKRLREQIEGQMMTLPDPSEVTKLPGYQAGLEAVMRSMAAQGYQGSGNMMTELQKYGENAYNKHVAQLLSSKGHNLNVAQAGAGPAYAGMSGLALLSHGVRGLAGALR